MHYLYILESISTGRKYIGSTEDIEKRLKQHNEGRVRSTKAFIPWKLVYHEAFKTKIEARKREIKLKANAWQRSDLYSKISTEPEAPSSNG